jgi:large subunit ribosomal protein L18
MDNKRSRQKRAVKSRSVIKISGLMRLTVHRTPRHIYAQVFSSDGSKVLVSSSTLDLSVRALLQSGSGNVTAAAAVGRSIAERALGSGISRVAFDRSGFKYHGRISALADAAREAGLQF